MLAISLILLVVFVVATTFIDLVQWLPRPTATNGAEDQMSADAVATSPTTAAVAGLHACAAATL